MSFMKYNESFIKGNVPRALIRFALPVMLASILQMVYSATDLVILGRFGTTSDVSGVATSTQIMLLITLSISGFTAALVVLLGQFSGEKNEKKLSATVGTGVVFFAIAALCVTVIMQFLIDPIITLMKTPELAAPAARDYLRICTLGTVFITGYNVCSSIMRGIGNSKVPLLFISVTCTINIFLDLLFVAVFRMGAAGAATATVIAQAFSLAFSLTFFKLRGIGFKVSRADIRLNKEIVRRLVKIGAPISLQEILVTLSFLLITAVVNGMGIVVSASVGVVEKLIGFLMMPSAALSTAVATMSAHNIGANQYDRARRCMWVGILTSLCCASVATGASWFFGDVLASIFSKDKDVIYNAALYLKTYSLDCLGVCVVFVLNGYFNSCNRSLFSMAHSLITTFAIRVPFTIIIARIPGATLFHLGIASPLSSLGSMIMCFIYLRYVNRKMAQERLDAVPAQ